MDTSRAEAERLLGIAEKLLQGRDLNGSRDFAILAQETEPLLDGSDQILAVVDVLIAAERRIGNNINSNHHDWYSILQIDRRSAADEPELIKKQYRRLALLLHPDKNKFPFADAAFKLVADAWAVLSDRAKKAIFDHELGVFSKVDLVSGSGKKGSFDHLFNQKLPVRRTSNMSGGGGGGATATANPSPPVASPAKFWTACPYCYNLYEYARVYEDCCLRCQNCERAFHAAAIATLPPQVPGKDAYYCCWAFFPMGFQTGDTGGGGKEDGAGFPNSMQPPPPQPPVFPPATPTPTATVTPNGGTPAARGGGSVHVSRGSTTTPPSGKKRGRPRKNPLPQV